MYNTTSVVSDDPFCVFYSVFFAVKLYKSDSYNNGDGSEMSSGVVVKRGEGSCVCLCEHVGVKEGYGGGSPCTCVCLESWC